MTTWWSRTGKQNGFTKQCKAMEYKHLYRLTKHDLYDIIVRYYPHLRGSLYKCTKANLIEEIKTRNIL